MAIASFEHKIRYSIEGAAFLLGVPERRVRDWANGYTFTGRDGRKVSKGPLLATERLDGDSISFYELIELLHVKALRDRKGLVKPPSLETIRKIVDNLKPELGDYPLASADLMKVGNQIVSQKVQENAVTEVSTLQHLLSFAKSMMENLEFKDGIAEAWFPIGKGVIEVNPRKRDGLPITKSGLLTNAIYNRLIGEARDIEAVAEWFDVEVEEIKDAILFEDQWRGKLAA